MSTMNYRLNELTSFPGWDTRADTNAPVNLRLPNSPLYTYDPQTGEAGFDTPREYNITKVNPVQSEEESYYKGYDPQIAEAQRVYPVGGGLLSRIDPVATYREQLKTGQIGSELYENAPFEYRQEGSDKWKVSPYLKDAYVKAGGKLLSDDDIVNGIIQGKYGNGDARKQALAALGLSAEDIERIRGLVNARIYAAQARPAKRRKPAAVPVSNTPRQERTLYQGMPMNWAGPQDPDHIYIR